MGGSPTGGNHPGFIPGAGHIPNVGEGDAISINDINRLSEVAKRHASFSTSSRGTHTSGPTGVTSYSSIQPYKMYHPWMMHRMGERIYINVGQFFVNRALSGGIAQITNGQLIQGSRNAWCFNSGHPAGAQVDSWNPPDGMNMAGAEIWFEDEDCNTLTNTMLFQQLDGVHTKFKTGLWYLEYAAWGGRQMELPYPDTATPILQRQNDAVTVFNAYSLKMTGRLVPQLRYAPASLEEDDNMWTIKRMVYPVATVDEYGNTYQALKSDVFHHLPVQDLAFQVSPFFAEGGWKLGITPGQVNGIVPKIDSVGLDEWPAPTLSLSGSGKVYVKATSNAQRFFPSQVEVIFQAGDPPPDTDANGYKHIATVTMVNEMPAVTQLAYGNLLVNKFKMGQSGSIWVWNA